MTINIFSTRYLHRAIKLETDKNEKKTLLKNIKIISHSFFRRVFRRCRLPSKCRLEWKYWKGTRMTLTKTTFQGALYVVIRIEEITFVSFFCQTFSTQFQTHSLIMFDEYRVWILWRMRTSITSGLWKLERWIQITNQSTSFDGFEVEWWGLMMSI